MATISQIKQTNHDNIRIKVLPSSITKTVDANMRDVIADELLDRGVIRKASTGAMATETRLNTKLILVEDTGFFVAFASGDAPDNSTTFASADVGWLWKKIADVQGAIKDRFTITGDDEYDLADGYMIDKIMVKPTVEEDAAKIGLTDGGSEILVIDSEVPLAPDVWKSVTYDVFADGGDVTIYFRGFTDDTEVIIYKRKL